MRIYKLIHSHFESTDLRYFATKKEVDEYRKEIQSWESDDNHEETDIEIIEFFNNRRGIVNMINIYTPSTNNG